MVGMETREIVRAAGGPLKLSRVLGVTHSAVSKWKKVPPKHALKVSRLSRIPLHVIQPDMLLGIGHGRGDDK